MNELSRRRFLSSLGLGAGAGLLAPVVTRLISEAQAQAPAARRFVLFGAHGFTHQWWRPPQHSGAISGEQLVLKGGGFTLAPMLEPLAAHQQDMLLLDGMAHDCRGVGGEIQHGGHFASFTCAKGLKSPAGPSFDQFLAPKLSAQAPQPSLLFGMDAKLAEGKEPLDTTTFAAGADRPRSHYVNALAMLEAVFGKVGAPQGPNLSDLKAVRLRDVLRADINRLHAQLPAPERARLELYTAAVEDYDRRRELRGSIKCDAPQGPTGSGVQAHFEAMFDLGILSLKCGMTNVVGIATGTGGQPRHNSHMPIYEDIGDIGSHGWDSERLLKYHRFHTGLIERLWTELINTPSPNGGTLADETVVIYCSTNGTVGDSTHHSNNYRDKNRAEWPVMMLTRVPGLRTGGDYIAFNDKVRTRTWAEFLHTLCAPLGVDSSGFGKGSNGDGDFHGPIEDILT